MTSDTATLLDRLVAALGADGIIATNLGRYVVDGLAPMVAVFPRTVEEVAQAMAVAAQHKAAIVPWGGGAHVALGNAPRRYHVALSLSRLNQVLEYEPADLTVSVQAGIALRALNEHLASNGQFLPLDPPGHEVATIGGILAANASGPLRYAHGTARDWVIGMKVVHADGRISKSGGKVVKNVAGYDMSKLYIGSLGALAVIVEANLKVATLPREQRTALLTAPTLDDTTRLAFALHDTGLSLRAMTLLNGVAAAETGVDGEGYALALLVAGESAAVSRSLADIEALCQEDAGCHMQVLDQGMQRGLWAAVRHACRPGSEGDRLLVKASVLPAQATSLVRAWEAKAVQGRAPGIVSHVAQGIVYGQWRGPSLADGEAAARLVQRLRTDVAALDGTAVVEACPLVVTEKIDVWGEPRGDFLLMRRLKEEMDSDGILSPGRSLGRL